MQFDDILKESIYQENEKPIFHRIFDKWNESGCAQMYEYFPEDFQREIFKAFSEEIFEDATADLESEPESSFDVPDHYFLKYLSAHKYDYAEKILSADKILHMLDRDSEDDGENIFNKENEHERFIHLFTLMLFADTGIMEKIDEAPISDKARALFLFAIYRTYVKGFGERLTVYNIVKN